MKKITTFLFVGILMFAMAGVVMAAPLTRDNVKGVIESVDTATGIVSIREHETGALYDIAVGQDDIAAAEVGLSASVNYFIDTNGVLVAEGASFFPGDSSGVSAAAIVADEVGSANIAEADGTTGQDTNTGTGVKTDHIQNGAINTPKLRNNAVKTAKIADGAVTAAKLKDGTALAEILDDDGPGSGLNADKLDGLHKKSFARVDAAGNVETIGSYKYSITKTYDYNIPGDEFEQFSSYPMLRSSLGYWYRQDAAQYGYAMVVVRLPQGATVTGLYCSTYDNEINMSHIMTWRLFRRLNTSTTREELATATYDSGAYYTTILIGSTTTIVNGVIDNTNYSYWIQSEMNRDFGTSALTSNIRDYGCRIQYTMTTVAP